MEIMKNCFEQHNSDTNSCLCSATLQLCDILESGLQSMEEQLASKLSEFHQERFPEISSPMPLPPAPTQNPSSPLTVIHPSIQTSSPPHPSDPPSEGSSPVWAVPLPQPTPLPPSPSKVPSSPPNTPKHQWQPIHQLYDFYLQERKSNCLISTYRIILVWSTKIPTYIKWLHLT